MHTYCIILYMPNLFGAFEVIVAINAVVRFFWLICHFLSIIDSVIILNVQLAYFSLVTLCMSHHLKKKN